LIEQENTIPQPSLIDRVALRLHVFLQRCRISTTVKKSSIHLTGWEFNVLDITDEAVPFGINFVIDYKTIEGLEDNPTAIENFCYHYVINIGNALLTEKCNRLLAYPLPIQQKSNIIIP